MTVSYMPVSVRKAALLWASVRLCAPDAYLNARSLREARRTIAAERRVLLIRPATDNLATLRWRRLGALVQAIDSHLGERRRGSLVGV